MAHIIEATTIEDVRRDRPDKIFYGVNTCWWTHRQQDLRQHRESSLPCDPRGGMLMETPDPEAFLATAEKNSEAYGEHGLDAFIAAHNDNCIVSPADHRNTCLRTWAEYNALLATKRNAKAVE